MRKRESTTTGVNRHGYIPAIASSEPNQRSFSSFPSSFYLSIFLSFHPSLLLLFQTPAKHNAESAILMHHSRPFLTTSRLSPLSPLSPLSLLLLFAVVFLQTLHFSAGSITDLSTTLQPQECWISHLFDKSKVSLSGSFAALVNASTASSVTPYDASLLLILTLRRLEPDCVLGADRQCAAILYETVGMPATVSARNTVISPFHEYSVMLCNVGNRVAIRATFSIDADRIEWLVPVVLFSICFLGCCCTIAVAFYKGRYLFDPALATDGVDDDNENGKHSQRKASRKS
eukprot:ANDGO_03326.mRNA.1 hypothetical protein